MKQVILYDIRSHYNVGAIFRTCDGAGVSRVFLLGLTPSPIDRFGRPVPEIHKTALGAETTIPYEVVSDIFDLVKKLKQEGSVVVAVEQSKDSVLLNDFVSPDNVVYIMGSETEGLPQSVLDVADKILELPMLGEKESLNVSVTCGIVLYHI